MQAAQPPLHTSRTRTEYEIPLPSPPTSHAIHPFAELPYGVTSRSTEVLICAAASPHPPRAPRSPPRRRQPPRAALRASCRAAAGWARTIRSSPARTGRGRPARAPASRGGRVSVKTGHPEAAASVTRLRRRPLWGVRVGAASSALAVRPRASPASLSPSARHVDGGALLGERAHLEGPHLPLAQRHPHLRCE